jgi:hypothetical protein
MRRNTPKEESERALEAFSFNRDRTRVLCLAAETNQHLVPRMTTSVALGQCAVQP